MILVNTVSNPNLTKELEDYLIKKIHVFFGYFFFCFFKGSLMLFKILDPNQNDIIILLVNTVLNVSTVAPKSLKLSHREVSTLEDKH